MSERRHLHLGEIRALLEEVGHRLADRGLEVDLLVVGGAAMALAYQRDRVTVDVDVMLPPPGTRAALAEVATELAADQNLPPDWLNTSATAWVPPLDAGWAATGTRVGGLNIVPASPQVLLAMKMLADRERDFRDLVTLVRHLGLRDAASVVAVFREVYPDGPPTREPDDDELVVSAQEVIDAAWPDS